MRSCLTGLLLIAACAVALPLHAQQRPLPGTVPLRAPDLELSPYEILFTTPRLTSLTEQWAERMRERLSRERRELFLASRFRAADVGDVAVNELAVPDPELVPVQPDTVAPDTIEFLPPLPERRRPTGDPGVLGGMIGENADLGLQVQAMGNLGGAWSRFSPCDPAVQFNCKPSLFPELKPDVEFRIRAGGTISERVHVDVDYDQAREFDAANNINVYYQGLRDEVLQRVEFGDVSIRLPTSRYLTQGVPAGNFGLMAAAQLGPIEFQTVFAQQKGDVSTKEFRLPTSGGQTGVEQDAELVIDDADYVSGQFFFLVAPEDLTGFPHIDVLGLIGTEAPSSVRPGIGGSIQIFRDERLGAQTGGQPGYFLAEATAPGATTPHTGTFRRLVQEQDYYIHSSGLWIMLRSPLRPDEALAVSYVTETSDTIGTINPESSPAGVTPTLRLLRGPASLHQPGSPTWTMEMHQVYRLDSSSEVDVNEIDLVISLGHEAGGQTFRDVLGQRVTLLRFFGLDEESPVDRLDAAQVFQPARDGFTTGGPPIGGTFIVFPTLRPFAEPAPVPSAQLTAADLLAALGTDANVAIYDEVDPVDRASSARFRLNFDYRVKVEGVVSSFNLGAFGLREGSERLYLGSRLLERGIDYDIDYELGIVTLNDPQALFALSPGAELRATWEQLPLFSIAPTSVFGASARYDLGPRGELNFVGLYQAEQSLMSRPQLGVEPGTMFLGGVSGRFDLGGALLDRAVSALGLSSNRPSAVSLTGEVAFSMPNPNRDGFAYLEDFESTDEIPLGLRRQDWKLGSAPQTVQGDRGTMPFVLDASTAVPLVWQHDFFQDGAPRGALIPSTQIDRGINVIGNERPEQVMWLTFGWPQDVVPPVPPPADARRWRSITTLLSTTGRDMSRAEYLEFYVSVGSGGPLALIFDIGTVSEDAFFVDSLGNVNGTYDENGREWGLGILDEEARVVDREVWGTDKDLLGLWDQPCIAEPHVTYPLADPRSNCTRGNGIADTEDLNGNGILDASDGQYFRFVVQLDQLSEYLVRDTAATRTGFRLYRIPLRSGEAVNGANDATWRFIRHLRMTIVGEPQTPRVLAIARMHIVGSRWTKRDVHGVRRGMLEDESGTSAGLADVRVGPVSAVTDGAVYRGPPGVGERAQDPNQQFDDRGFEINEKSLRLAYTDLGPDDRAEVYYRYPQQPRNMLSYRELRLWVLPREGSWGPDGTERFQLRIGTDPRNFYLYQSPLRPPTGPRAVTPADWLPEIVIDVQQWLDLKAQAEQRLIERGAGVVAIDTLWSADSTYAIVLEDRARAPNLAAVREIVFGVYNGGTSATSGEVWIDDLRVGIPDRDPGAAGNITLNVNAGDFVSANITVANQGPLFRQLNQNATYVGTRTTSIGADARLDRLLPASWGVDLPVTVTHTTSTQAPTFLSQSDVQTDHLSGLRDAGSDATRVGLRLSKRTPSANPVVSWLVDGSSLRLSYATSENRSIMARSEQRGFNGDFTWSRNLSPHTLPFFPGFVRSVLRALVPDVVESSSAFTRLLNSRLNWSPASLSFGTGYTDQMTRSFRFDRILALPGDTAVIGLESPRQGLHNDASLTLRPFSPLTLSFAIGSDRDLLAAERAASRPVELDALRRARTKIGGMDIGWERSRTLRTTFSYRPDISSWLRAEYTWTAQHARDRSPSYLDLTIVGSDTTAEMQQRFGTERQIGRRLTAQLPALARALNLDSTSFMSQLLRRVDVIDVQWRSTLSSQFERESFLPGYGYQFGLGSLDSYKVIGADTAVRAQQRGEFRLGTGVRIIGALRVETAFSSANTEMFDARGGTRIQKEIGWPRITLQWRPQDIHERVSFITSLATTAGVERIERTTDYLAAENQLRRATELRFPFSLSIGLPRAFLATYRASYSTGETLDPTGGAESGGLQQDLSLSAMIPAGPLASRLDGPIAATLTFSQQGQRQCRYTMVAEADGCIAFLDYGTRSATLLLESGIRDLRIGMQASYTGRQNHVGLRNTSSQFQLGFFGRFNLNAGQLPERFR